MVTVTGHGLKDIDTALSTFTDLVDTVVDARRRPLPPRPRACADMTTFVNGPVTASVPATSANLGPGYDSLGLALDLRDRLTAQVRDGSGLEIVMRGHGDGVVPLDEGHLVHRAMRAAFERMGVVTARTAPRV